MKKEYDALSKKELIALLQKTAIQKSCGLVWEEDKIIEHSVAECALKKPLLPK